MRTAEAIIKERYPFYDQVVYGKDVELCGEQVSKLINTARIEAIKECSEVAKSEWKQYEGSMGHIVDKQSILSLIEQVK